MKNIFANRLITARRMAGLSLQELAELSGMTKQAISNYEIGLRNPDSSILIKLAVALKVDVDYFLQEENPGKIILSNINFREESKHEPTEIESIKLKTIDFLERYLELEKLASDTQEFDNPLKEFSIRTNKDVEKAAILIRKKWKLGFSPIINVVELLEEKGVKVLELSQSLDFEGLSSWVGKIPVIVVNLSVAEVTRRRFTLLHELAHLILEIAESVPKSKVEWLCNAFAGALLLPKEAIVKIFSSDRTSISMQEIKQIKEYFGISIMAIMVRALIIGLIPKESYDKWKNSDLRTYNSGEFIGEEKPKRFNQLLRKCLNENKITLNKAAFLAAKSIEKIQKEIENDLRFSF